MIEYIHCEIHSPLSQMGCLLIESLDGYNPRIACQSKIGWQGKLCIPPESIIRDREHYFPGSTSIFEYVPIPFLKIDPMPFNKFFQS